MWANSFHKYMDDSSYRDTVKENSTLVYKTNAVKCKDCFGEGYIRKIKKDGNHMLIQVDVYHVILWDIILYLQRT